MPLRDDRRGRRATLTAGTTPLRPQFHASSAATLAGTSLPASEADPSGNAEPSDSDLPSILPQDDERPWSAPAFQPASVRVADSSSRATAHSTVLDPLAFLSALAQPLHAARDAYVRFVSGTTALPTSVDAEPELDAAASAGAGAGADALAHIEREASVIERSFANEFASLVGRPASANVEAAAQHAPRPLESVDAPPATITSENARERSDDAQGAVASTILQTDAHRIVVRSSPPLVERAVPLTRLPLRPQEEQITWTTVGTVGAVGAVDADCDAARTQRHDLLERSVRNAGGLPVAVLERAYREEDLEGRTIALRALARHFPLESKEIFVEALRLGSDDERALAIDGLASAGARAELHPAFGDRVDAIAAKAALAYVGSRSRDEYRVELAPYADVAQVDKILTLLAGIIE